ncbi:hypothetical protein D3C73_1654020 [compost metagenome]
MANQPASPEKIVNVKVPESLKDAFYAAASAQDQTASQVIRDFMRKYVAQHGQGKLL